MTRVLRFWVYLVGEKVWVLVLYLIKIIGLQGPGLIGAIGETTKGSQRRQIKCTSVWYRILSLNMHVLSIQKLL